MEGLTPQRRMGLHWKPIQVVAVRFLLFWVIFVRFRAFFCVLVGCCTFLRVFAYFSALGVPLVALGTLLGALGTLLGRSWGALGALLGALGALLGTLVKLLGRSWSLLAPALAILARFCSLRGSIWGPRRVELESFVLRSCLPVSFCVRRLGHA